MAIEIQHLTKRFRGEQGLLSALQDVNLTVGEGELLCILGPSGCGKSTLLRIMAGLEQPDGGRVVNSPVQPGFVFQNFALFPWLTAQQNIAFGLQMKDLPAEKTNKLVNQQMERLGLEGLGGLYPAELSGGQKQRTGLARALAVDPDVLFLDEPFSALDAFTAETLRQDLLDIWQQDQKTVVMVTHLPEEAAQLADRIVVMSARPGTVVADITNRLPRPRDTRNPQCYKLVDRLRAMVAPKAR